MEPLIALGGILLGAIPTFLLVWLLYWYVTRVFFRPLQKTLQKRHDATEGLRAAAESNIVAAEHKAAQYQESLRTARAELYQQQEQERQKAIERRAESVRRARQQAEAMTAQARREIEQDVAEAQNWLAAESETLARSIIRAILEPAASGRSAGGTEAAR
jgi:F-type H+-transporting ATPase subunit b